MKIKCDYAFIDVTTGRSKLAKLLQDVPRIGPCPTTLRIPVTLTGYVTHINSADDGVSQEFSVDVEKAVFGLQGSTIEDLDLTKLQSTLAS